MSRQARVLSETGMYHIVFCGMGKQNIFKEAEDCEKLKEILEKVKYETGFSLYAYCFLPSRVHLFLKEQSFGTVSGIMAKILSRYAVWFNRKYDRSGALFADRYKSEPVEDEEYLIPLVRYIHQTSAKSKVSGYVYSSYDEYLNGEETLTDTEFILEMINANRERAIEEFKEMSKVTEKEDFEISDSRRKTDGQIRRIIRSRLGGIEPEEIKSLGKAYRDDAIKRLITEAGISKSALERATGISRNTIIRVCLGKKRKSTADGSSSRRNASLPAHLM